VSGARPPFRASLRAGALLRTLDAALALARGLARDSLEDVEIVRLDARTSPLLGPPDPFSALAAAAARTLEAPAVAASLGELERGPSRHLFKPSDVAKGLERFAPRSSGVSPRVAPARPAPAPPVPAPCERSLNEREASSAARGNSVSRAPSTADRALARLLADSPSAAVRERIARRALELSSPSRAKLETVTNAARWPDAAQLSAAEPLALDPERARHIWRERACNAGLSEAFRSPLRNDVSSQSASSLGTPLAQSTQARPAAAQSRAVNLGGETAEKERSSPAFRELSAHERGPTTTRELGSEHALTASLPATVRACAPSLGAGASGLRRLAAFASERLESLEPEIAPVLRAEPPRTSSSLAEELDSVLRAELLRSGIDARSLVR